MAGHRLCLSLRGQRRRPLRHGASRARISSKTPSPPSTFSKRCEQAAFAGIAFSSTGSIYGEPTVFPTPENGPFPVQTSLYGASKLAGEGLIAAYCNGFGFQGFIFRFVSILGRALHPRPRFDFYNKLLDNPHTIEVLGNGKQRKSYLLRAGLHRRHADRDRQGTGARSPSPTSAPKNTAASTIRSAGFAQHLGVQPQRRYTGGERGWIGDSPFIFLDTPYVRSLGWRPKFSIQEGVIRTLEYLQSNDFVLKRRELST